VPPVWPGVRLEQDAGVDMGMPPTPAAVMISTALVEIYILQPHASSWQMRTLRVVVRLHEHAMAGAAGLDLPCGGDIGGAGRAGPHAVSVLTADLPGARDRGTP
jgi:hypothetical protein